MKKKVNENSLEISNLISIYQQTPTYILSRFYVFLVTVKYSKEGKILQSHK